MAKNEGSNNVQYAVLSFTCAIFNEQKISVCHVFIYVRMCLKLYDASSVVNVCLACVYVCCSISFNEKRKEWEIVHMWLADTLEKMCVYSKQLRLLKRE